MANYAVTTTIHGPDTLTNVWVSIEAAIEALVDTTGIWYLEVYPTGGGLYEGVLVVDT